MIERTLFFYPGSFLPASAGIERRAELVLEYLIARSQRLLVILANAPAESAGQVEARLSGKGSVVVVRAKRAGLSRARRNVLRAFHQVLRGRIAPFDSEVFLPLSLRSGFRAEAAAFSPTLSVITYVPYAGLIADLPANSPALLDPIDIFQRIHRAYADESPLKRLLARIRFGYRERGSVYKSEKRILARYQGILAISREDERAYLSAGLAAERIGFLEACVRDFASTPTAAEPGKDIDVLFIGARFPGTEKALAFLVSEVLPRLHGPLRLAVVGRIGGALPEYSARVPPWVTVEAPGVIEDVRPFYRRARIVAIPIPLGTGTSVKTQEALSQGACVVTSTAGARLQGVEDGINCLVRDAPGPFAKAILELLEDPARRTALGAAAVETARKLYSNEAVHAYLDAFIKRVTGLDPRLGARLRPEEDAVGL